MAPRLDDPSVLEPAAIARILGADPERGLTTEAAARRLAEDGPNALRQAPPVPAWRKVLAQFRDPLIYLLLAAIGISLVAWSIEGRVGWPVDAIVIALIVVMNAVLGYVQEAKAENAVAALTRMTAVTSAVVREGVVARIPSDELVRGDVLLLGEGDSVGADARLLQAAALRVQEASLTGESEAVLKDATTLPRPVALADRTNMVFKGTAVAQAQNTLEALRAEGLPVLTPPIRICVEIIRAQQQRVPVSFLERREDDVPPNNAAEDYERLAEVLLPIQERTRVRKREPNVVRLRQ